MKIIQKQKSWYFVLQKNIPQIIDYKGFILLSDVYVKQDNNYQAATLESIIENHDGEEVVNGLKFKWEQIVKEGTD